MCIQTNSSRNPYDDTAKDQHDQVELPPEFTDPILVLLLVEELDSITCEFEKSIEVI